MKRNTSQNVFPGEFSLRRFISESGSLNPGREDYRFSPAAPMFSQELSQGEASYCFQRLAQTISVNWRLIVFTTISRLDPIICKLDPHLTAHQLRR